MRQHGLLDDDAARRRRQRDAGERRRLVALWQQTRGSADQLADMARQMPELAGGAKQVSPHAAGVDGCTRMAIPS